MMLLYSCDEGDPGDGDIADDDVADDDVADDDSADDDDTVSDDDADSDAPWEMISEGGFGTTNTRASGMVGHEGFLYAGTINQEDAAQIWRHDGGGEWTKVNENGFGANNMAVQGITVFDGELIVGTTNNAQGCEVLRYDGGTAWTRINESGFDPEARGMVARVLLEFEGQLYAGVRNDTGGADEADHENMTGAQVWRYDGGTEWTQVNEDGFGNIPAGYNRSVECMAVLDGALYAGTWNDDDGGQVWRYDSGTSWTQINESGFGQGPFVGLSVALSMETHEGDLFVGTRNDDTGAEVWRYDGGTSWTQVNESGFAGGSASAIWDLTEYDGQLFAGTMGDGGVWRHDGGTSWIQANENGFGDGANSMVTAMTVLDDRLYAGTNNTTSYAEVWGSTDNLE